MSTYQCEGLVRFFLTSFFILDAVASASAVVTRMSEEPSNLNDVPHTRSIRVIAEWQVLGSPCVESLLLGLLTY